jgi:HSP20 family protein
MVLTTFDPFVQFERQFNRLAQRSLGSGAGMPMDGVRRDGEVALRFDLPGVDPASIDVTVDRGVLTVSAKRDEEYAENDKPFIRERITGTFTRRVYLSDDLDTSAVEASFTDGVLSVRIPVAEKAQPRRIEIQGAPRVQQGSVTPAAEVTEGAEGGHAPGN